MAGCVSALEEIAESWYFCLRLKDKKDWAIFKFMCQVLIQSIEKSYSTDSEFVLDQIKIILKRCSTFFKKKPTELTKKVAMGLIGELLFLMNYVAPKTGWDCALYCWKGPTGDPQDFVVEDTVIEIKTTEAAKKNSITVSNSEQLSSHDSKGYLFVQSLSGGVPPKGDVITLHSLVSKTEAKIEEATGDKSLLEVYLNQLGYIPDAGEAHRPYQVLESTFYALDPDFPKITTDMLPYGVTSIKYTIDLNLCQKYINHPNWINHE